jgi:hypothetical protein
MDRLDVGGRGRVHGTVNHQVGRSITPRMRLFSGRTAGGSAAAHFVRARRRWRRRVARRPVAVVGAPVVLAVVAESVVGTSAVDWALGCFVGAGVAVVAGVWDSPPAHIENWRTGAQGERRTARALHSLERDGWTIRHDLPAARGNRDHIAIGPSGVYLLDTKALAGTIHIDGDVVTVERPDNPTASYRLDRLASAHRAEAARLKHDLEAAGCRAWVQAVVVIWGNFPQRIVQADRIVYLHGDELTTWLRQHPAARHAARTAQLTGAVRALATANGKPRA